MAFDFFSSFMIGWYGSVAITVLIMIFIASIVFMLSRFFNKPEWEAWARYEANQVLISLIIIVNIAFFVGLVGILSDALVSKTPVGTSGTDPFKLADDYLGELQQSLMKTIRYLMIVRGMEDFFSSIYIQVGPGGWGWGFSPLAGLAQIANIHQSLVGIMISTAASIMAQRLLLSFINAFMFTVVLPAGLILRTFPLGRRAGAFLIATSLGMYVVFPLIYVMNYAVKMEIDQRNASMGGWQLSDALLLVSSAWGPLGMILTVGGIGLDNHILVLQNMAIVVPQAVFLPALTMVITVSFIRTMVQIFSASI